MLILLTWMLLRQIPRISKIEPVIANQWRIFSRMGLILVIIQIMLGGWVSSNFAGIACSDFPICQGSLLPLMDFSYTLDNSGLPLSEERLTAIHWMHRLGSLLTAIYLSWLALNIMKFSGMKLLGVSVLGLVVTQCALGISNVLLGLPLMGAVLHNAVAMMLLIALVLLNFRLQELHKE